MLFLPQVVAELPFTLEGYLVVVEGKVNGVPARLILDTGAGAGLYTPKSATKLNLKITGQTMVGGGGANFVPAQLTAAKIELGSAVQESQLGVILELPGGAKGEFDGIVGYPFLRNYVVQLDYARKRVRFFDPKRFSPDPKAQKLPMTLRMNIPEIPGRIDGIAGRIRVDTGYSGTLTFTSPTVQKFGLDKKYPKKVETVLGKGVGGVTLGDVTRIGALELGDLRIPGIVTGLASDKTGALADSETIALLGGEVLSRFTVTLDYPGAQFYLTKNADFAKPFIYSRAGFSGVFESEDYKVVTVVPGGPAQDAGLKKEELVLALNGKPMKELGLTGSREIFRLEPGTRVEARVRATDGRERVVVLVLKDVL